MLRQPCERDLRLQNVLLRYFTDRVLDSCRFDGLTRNSQVLIVNPHFVAGEQQIVKGLVDVHANLQPHLVKLRFCDIHVRFGHTGPQRSLAAAGKGLADTDHVLCVVEVPGPL